MTTGQAPLLASIAAFSFVAGHPLDRIRRKSECLMARKPSVVNNSFDG